ncbi:PAS domain S-box-containing protein [Desulfobaculum xiamenense]|uniref:histidine kinase n=1 Tax=Desulfobaculum xiamenense TaxID=995050 RepID=A0A846QP28_9BACT|nr:PAS domain S-box protein [Desulfobaculum xiamenense]NJB67165.1 PAS domain S-box-containing protein [Desulfobaculum xiamenense]
MPKQTIIYAVFGIYLAALLTIALAVERSPSLRKRVSDSPLVYALSLAVYHTVWSFYGITGQAATSGLAYLTTHIGSTLGICLWPSVLRRIIRIKRRQRITSVADFLSISYGRSQGVAMLVTIIAVIGSLPYVSLQIKGILASLTIMTEAEGTAHALHGPILVTIMILFTILAGVRRIDPTERHQGMVAAVAAESIVKLVAFVTVGIVVTYSLNDGFGDLFRRAAASPWAELTGLSMERESSYASWMTGMILAMNAILFLPRQFHVAVVENSDERHIRHAIWILPLYMLLFSFFAFPLALSGLLAGMPIDQADTFVLSIPHANNMPWLAGLAFFGGFSAGLSMVMITTMTMANMITNHLLLPMVEIIPPLGGLRRRLLQCRWAVVAMFILLGYGFNAMVGESYMLVRMGSISFAAVLQFAPAAIGGLYWSRASRAGALSGLGAGFAVWCHTLLLPAFIRSGWLSASILSEGPFGIALLVPERLLGLTAMDSIAHGVFWSMLVNISCYITVSLASTPVRSDAPDHELFMDDSTARELSLPLTEHLQRNIPLAERAQRIERLFHDYYSPEQAHAHTQTSIRAVIDDERDVITIEELMRIRDHVERTLTGSLGAAMARRALHREPLFDEGEQRQLAQMYANILTELHVPPNELRRRINFHQEREALLTAHADELAQANRQLRAAEEKYRSIFENGVEGMFQSTPDGRFMSANPSMARILGYDTPEDLVASITDIGTQVYASPLDRQDLIAQLTKNGFVAGHEHQIRRKDGSRRWVEIHARLVRDETGAPAHIDGTLKDISKRKQAEAEILRASRYVKSIIDSMPSIMISVDEELRVTHWNLAAESATGLASDSALNRYIGDVYAVFEPQTPALRTALETGTPQRLEKIPRLRDESLRYIEIMIYPMSAEGKKEAVIREDDVTERVRMEEMMIQTEKMMSVGGLAAGMAHEINNPLGGILQATQNIRRRLSTELEANRRVAEEVACPLDHMLEYMRKRKILDMLDGIRESGERAARIVANMLEFSRRSESKKTFHDMGELLDRTLDLAAKDYDLKKSYDFRHVTIVRDYSPDVPAVPCIASELEQVFLNILKNAAQAMTFHGSSGPPTITIRTLLHNGMARVDITDNGPGMDEHTRLQVFKPFFTTKAVGIGTGLGLSVSYFIITTNHGGQFTVESAPGKGATFSIRLPIPQRDDAHLPPEIS